MSGFEFSARKELEICGRRYPFDVTDPAYIEAVVTDFAAILAQYDELDKLSRAVAPDADEMEGNISELTDTLLSVNSRIAESGRAFIVKALGQSAFEEIFNGRRPSSADLIELCAYIYGQALEQRSDIVNKYVRQQNREDGRANRKTAGKPGGWRKKLRH